MLLSPRGAGGPVYVSGRANSVLKGGESPYDVGLRKVAEDPYDELGNQNGVIQLGLDENKVGRACFGLYCFKSSAFFKYQNFLGLNLDFKFGNLMV